VKVRYKIALTVLPLLIISIVAVNVIFGFFFQGFIQTQEESQVGTMADGISSYFKSAEESYLGSLNDWSHWDDTYFFLTGDDPDYIEKNLYESTFDNLDISFLILLDSDNAVKYRQYYADGSLKDFPADFFGAFSGIEDAIGGRDDFYGIMQLGGSYYFLAAGGVTDSLSEAAPVGKLIIGRQLDADVIGTIEKISGCTVSRLSSGGSLDPGKITGGQSAVLTNSDIAPSQDSMNLTFVIPNDDAPGASLVMDMMMTRTLFISAMENMRVFAIANTAILLTVYVVTLFLLGAHLSKPTSRLVGAIKQLDITGTPIARLDVIGRDEFSFIRQSVNNLLSNIEVNHAQLVESREELRATLISVGDGVITVDNSGLVTFLNPVAESLTGWSLNDACGQPIEKVFDIVNEYSREQVTSPIRLVFERDEIIELANHTLLISKDGTERPIEDTAAPIRDQGGVTKGCVLVFRDFSERKEKQKWIEYLSYHDQLTSLYNRRYFENALKVLPLDQSLPLSFIYADLNGLKIINDAFGHESGDLLIQWVAELLLSECGPNDIVARIGGDEFVVLMPRTGKDKVEAVVERLKANAGNKKLRDIDLSISFGWDTKEEAGQSALEVLKNAEDLMYRKKILNNTSKRSGFIKSIIHTLHVKCPREEAHSKRVSDLCESIGTACGLDSDRIKELAVSGELHDIGKIAVDEIVLNKTDPLTQADWAQIRRHPETGCRLLGATREYSNISEYVLSHHERWDGLGYPRGLRGEEIDWMARVISVADSYDAMTTDRPYRKALDPETAAREIRAGAGSQFDPDIARVFVEKVLLLEW
jgi:diguanylate cyclase (GGDEF)-like protein/PAS domain S-box-containing protein